MKSAAACDLLPVRRRPAHCCTDQRAETTVETQLLTMSAAQAGRTAVAGFGGRRGQDREAAVAARHLRSRARVSNRRQLDPGEHLHGMLPSTSTCNIGWGVKLRWAAGEVDEPGWKRLWRWSWLWHARSKTWRAGLMASFGSSKSRGRSLKSCRAKRSANRPFGTVLNFQQPKRIGSHLHHR